MRGNRIIRSRAAAAMRRATAESLEGRTLLTVAFTAGPAFPDSPTASTAQVTGFTLGRINPDANIDVAVDYLLPDLRMELRVVTNNGTGAFSHSLGGWIDPNGRLEMLRTGNYNGDGALDLFHVRAGANTIVIQKNSGTGAMLRTLHEPFSYGAAAAFDYTTADMTGDGLTDIITTGSNGLKIYRNLGTDFFSEMYNAGLTGLRPCVQAIDMNADGRRDLIFGINDGQGEQIGVLLRNADGSFQPIKRSSVSATPKQIRAGHFNTDNILDLAVLEHNPSVAFTGSVEVLSGN